MNATHVLHFLKRIAREAGSIMMERIDGQYKVYEKPDQSRVTDVDLAISKLLQAQVEAELDGIGLYSEESPKSAIDRSKPYIIADELDGTSYYIDLKKGFSHQSAYYHPEHGLCVGLVYYPRIDTLIYAVKGQGAYIEEGGEAPRRVAPPAPKPMEALTFAHPLRYRGERYNNLYRKLGADDGRILRTDARRTLMMAKGELDVNIFLSPHIPYWDLSGEKVIVEELGYSHSYLNRQPVEFGKPPPKPNLGYLICPEKWKEKFFTETPRLIA
ncbi:MAG: hypothetical protein NXI25_15290 [bacterium]|nr:hypothetical protein [bacterium]